MWTKTRSGRRPPLQKQERQSGNVAAGLPPRTVRCCGCFPPGPNADQSSGWTAIVLLLARSDSSDEKEEWSMTQSAAPLIQPARERTGEQTDAAQGTALLLQQSQEDLCLAERV